MGDRAVITTSRDDDIKNSQDIGIYLHWYGDSVSVRSFLTYCRLKGYSSPERNNYGWVNLANVISNYIGTGMSCGLDKCENLDCNNFDNGTYVIHDWKIEKRVYSSELAMENFSMYEKMMEIDQRQPEHMQMGSSKIQMRLIEEGHDLA